MKSKDSDLDRHSPATRILKVDHGKTNNIQSQSAMDKAVGLASPLIQHESRGPSRQISQVEPCQMSCRKGALRMLQLH